MARTFILWACVLAAPGASADQWETFTPPDRSGQQTVYDPVRDRMLSFGGDVDGFLGSDDIWALSLSEPMQWTRVVTQGPAPADLDGRLLYDSRRDRVILWDSRQDSIWTLSLSEPPTWSVITAATEWGDKRQNVAAVYDSLGDRLIAFGGCTGPFWNDTWALPLGGTLDWIPLITFGNPTAREGALVAMDPLRHEFVMYGGFRRGSPGFPGASYQDVWRFNFVTRIWRDVTPSTVPFGGVFGWVMAFDRRNDRLVLLGNPTSKLYLLDSVDGSPWQERAMPGPAPETIDRGEAIFEESRQRFVAGFQVGVWAVSSDTSPVWFELLPAFAPPPPRRSGHRAFLDARRERMLVVGGGASIETTTVWQLPLTSGTPRWSVMPAASPPSWIHPIKPFLHDLRRDRLVTFGERVDLALSLGESPTWTPLGADPSRPAILSGYFTSAYDARRDRAIVFRQTFTIGHDGGNEMWSVALDGTPRWSRIESPFPTEHRALFGEAIYDPEGDRVLALAWANFFDGTTSYDTLQVWALSLSDPPTWSVVCRNAMLLSRLQFETVHTRAASLLASLTVDPLRHRLIGFRAIAGPEDYGTLWTMPLDGPSTWTRLDVEGGVNPQNRIEQSAIYDPFTDRLVMYGGRINTLSTDLGDTWFLPWGTPQLPEVECAPIDPVRPGGQARVRLTIRKPKSKAARYALQIWGERSWGVMPFELLDDPEVPGWSLDLGLSVPDSAALGVNPLEIHISLADAPESERICSVPLTIVAPPSDPDSVADFALAGATQNPVLTSLSIAFSLRGTGPATLELLDIGGRSLWRRDVTSLGPGPHVVAAEPERRPAPGLYLIRLSEGSRTTSRRVVVLR